MGDYEWKSQFRDTRSIFNEHGLITWLLYWLTGTLSLASISHWARWLPDEVIDYKTHDKDTGKVKPWLQDLIALFLYLISVLAIYLSFRQCKYIACAGAVLTSYLLFDSLSRHARILWFDDIEPRAPEPRRKVSSHRRILFLGFLSYIQSIFLFTSIHHIAQNTPDGSFSSAFERSFGSATLLAFPQPIMVIDYIQISVSIFYLAVVVATAASIAYKREEVGEND